ncbi:MAG: hypothetical protein GY952_12005 [Rhodobacteraceae bacterium]|nr:hypothetical protein [Paracoccaceae bacterium]
MQNELYDNRRHSWPVEGGLRLRPWDFAEVAARQRRILRGKAIADQPDVIVDDSVVDMVARDIERMSGDD